MSSATKKQDKGPLEALGRWYRLKKFQIEITFGAYMFTPMEKFLFYSIIFLLTSLTVIAAILYLPQHVLFLIDRAWFYLHGEQGGSMDSALNYTKEAARTLTKTGLDAITTAASGVGGAKETVQSLVREL